ncbi:MAG: DUF4055 domain-containing protein [Alphaproteobacteria bacterium]
MSQYEFKTHPKYDEMKGVWKTCRDAACGQRAIHKGGELYLSKLNGQDDKEYKAYLMRSVFFGATGRTVEGMSGLVFRKAMSVEVPDAVTGWGDNITATGKSLKGFSKQAVNEVITVGRAGILVDFPSVSEGAKPKTKMQSDKMGLRPYLSLYQAEDIIYWETATLNNLKKLFLVDLTEKYYEGGEEKLQVRRLTLEGGHYVQCIYRKVGEKGTWEKHEEFTPQVSGKNMYEIPFYFLAANEPDTEIQDPVIEELAYVNISHYRNSADLENGAHISGLPTPYITGITSSGDEEEDEFYVGSNAAWVISDSDAKVGYLQVGAEGFAALEKLMDRKEGQMAALGARLLAPEKKAAEAAETAQIKKGAETSVLATLVGSVGDQIQKAIKFAVMWAGYDVTDVRFELSKDFMSYPMTPQMLKEWLAAWQSGGVSDLTFYEGLQTGELVAETLGFEEEQQRKEDSVPAIGGDDEDRE